MDVSLQKDSIAIKAEILKDQQAADPSLLYDILWLRYFAITFTAEWRLS